MRISLRPLPFNVAQETSRAPISIIAAVAKNGVIGNNNQLPWRLPADLAHFKKITMGKPMLMGRLTWESIGKPLPGRVSLVLSKNQGLKLPGSVHRYSSLAEVLESRQVLEAGELMVIGGAELYALMLPLANRLYLTIIDHDFQGDTRFPDFDKADWLEVKRDDHLADANNPWPYSFIQYLRR